MSTLIPTVSIFSQVIFVRKLQPFPAVTPHEYQSERKYDIYFADGKIFAQFRYLQFSFSSSTFILLGFNLVCTPLSQMQEDFAFRMSAMS